nr:putative ribonuclease H-like domain-containing protein [Tanacetum cinerariifolium]
MARTDNESDDASVHSQATNAQQLPNIQPQIITTVSNNNAKFLYLKKDEYEVWAIKMEYWITNNDMNIWKRESKARTTLLQSILDDHVADFHYMDDATDICTIKAWFGGNVESKKIRKSMLKQEFSEFRIGEAEGLHKGYDRMQKILSQLNQLKAKPEDEDINLKFPRALPSSWSQVALTLKTKGGLELLSFDDLDYKLKTLEVDVKGYTTFSSSQSACPSHSAFVSTTNASKKMSYGDSPSYSLTPIYSAPSNSKTGSHRSGNKAGRKIDFDKKESARFNKKKVRCYKCQQRGHFARECRAGGGNDKQRYSSFKIKEIKKKEEDSKALITVDILVDWTDHDSESDGIIAKEFGMIASCDSEDAIEEGAGANTEEASTADDAREFALMGVTSEVHNCPFGCDNNYNELHKQYKEINEQNGLGFNNCIRENELGWDDSAFSVFTTNSKDVEGRPIFNRFAKADSMKVMPLPLSGDYTSLPDHNDLKESRMSYGIKSSTSSDSKSVFNDFISCGDSDKSSEVNTNDFASSDSSVKSSEPKPNDSTSRASSSSVATSENEAEIDSNVGTPIQEPIIDQELPSFSCNSSDKNENTSRTFCNKNGYFNKKAGIDGQQLLSPQQVVLRNHIEKVYIGYPRTIVDLIHLHGQTFQIHKENPFSAAEDEGVFNSGCSRSMTGNKENWMTFKHFKAVKYRLEVVKICDKKNRVLFTDTECLVLSKDFKLPDDSVVVLKILRKHNPYTINLNNLCLRGNLACLVAHALFDESVKRYRRMGHVNYKNMNRLVKGNLVRGLHPKLFKNDHTCVACCKGKQHKASYKAVNAVSSISEPLQLLHMDLFGPTSIRSIDHKYYCLVITDDYSRLMKATLLDILQVIKPAKVYNVSNKRVEETMNLRFLEEKPNVQGLGHEWYFDLDYLTDTLGYKHVQANQSAGTQGATTNPAGAQDVDSDSNCDEQVIIIPSYPSHSIQGTEPQDTSGDEVDDSLLNFVDEIFQKELARLKGQEQRATSDAESLGLGFANDAEELQTQASAITVPPSSIPVPTISIPVPIANIPVPTGYTMVSTNDVPVHTSSSTDLLFVDEPTTRFPSSTVEVSPMATTRINTIHPQSIIIGDPNLAVQMRSKVKQTTTGEYAFISYINDQQRDNHTDFQHCLFTCFLSQVEPRSVAQALEDPSWVDDMQEEMQQFKFQNVWVLVDLPEGKYAIGTKWILKNKRDARGIVVQNKARLVAQGHRQEEGIDYDEVFALVAIRWMLRVYYVVKALYGLHQAPRAWYATLSTFLLKHGYRRGIIDKTLFLKKTNRDIILVQVYANDIIFGSTKKAWCDEFEVLMKGEF